jgi:hypothetical protein
MHGYNHHTYIESQASPMFALTLAILSIFARLCDFTLHVDYKRYFKHDMPSGICIIGMNHYSYVTDKTDIKSFAFFIVHYSVSLLLSLTEFSRSL